MKKKLFFKLFIFAVIGSLVTMTSCKDYDDDIDGLKTDVTGLQTELTTLNSDIESAQKAATEALAKAQEALTAAQAAGKASDVAALQTEVATIKTQLTELSGLKAEVTALMAELQTANEAQLAEIEGRVQELSDQLKLMLGGMVTNVELELLPGTNPDWKFSTIKEKANVFEEGIDNAITFVKDKQIQTTQTFVIRVSPTNAEITPEMISLQNSKGETYDNIEVVSVKPYDKLLTTTRSTNGSGLWEVTVRLKEYDAAEFTGATVSDSKKVLFAVAVDNTKTAENPMVRKVITDYDITLSSTAATPMNSDLYYLVDGVKLSEIRNRSITNEYKWKPSTTSIPTPAVEAITTGDNSNVATDNDDRSSLPLYPAVQGQPIKISLSKDDYKTTPDNVRALYVTLDTKGVDPADPSELNAWQSYSYKGLNTVVEGTETEIIISGSTAINDEIGFRVYAVNIDGTLVDPDGKAFYVSVGTPAGTWPTVATVATPTSTAITPSADVAVTLSKLTGAYSYEWTTDKAEVVNNSTPKEVAFNIAFLPATGNALFTTSGSGSTFSAPDFSQVKKIRAIPTEDSWLKYKDNKVYNGKLTIKNSTGHVLTTLNVTFKKELPTAAPEGFGPKTGQIVNGIYNAYLIPTANGTTPSWTASSADKGMMLLDNVFTFPTGLKGNFDFRFAASEKDGDQVKDVTVKGNESIVVHKDFIDNSTKHATVVAYNFGPISTETKVNGQVVAYKVDVLTFQTVYNNIYNNTYSWNWATRAQLGLDADEDLPYSTTFVHGEDAIVYLDHIYGVSTTASMYNAFLSKPYQNSLSISSVQIVTTENNAPEYYEQGVITNVVENSVSKVKVTLAPKGSAPAVDVPSTLLIKAKDMYGKDVTIRLNVLVKK